MKYIPSQKFYFPWKEDTPLSFHAVNTHDIAQLLTKKNMPPGLGHILFQIKWNVGDRPMHSFIS